MSNHGKKRPRPRSIDAIQIRPILASGRSASPTTLRLPVTLGRQTLATLWWKACPQACQAWNPAAIPCDAHCRPLRRKANLARLSRSMLCVDRQGLSRITAKHKSLVQYQGPRRLRHAQGAHLVVGEDWMTFRLVGVADPWQQSIGKTSTTNVTRTRRRIWLESSSSSNEDYSVLGEDRASQPYTHQRRARLALF